MAETIDHTTIEYYEVGKAQVQAVVDRILWDAGRIHLVGFIAPNSAARALLAALAQGREVTVIVFKDGQEVARDYCVAAGKGKLFTCSLRDGLTHGVYVAQSSLVGNSVTGQEGAEVVVLDEDPARILAHLSQRATLTALPEWAPWLVSRMEEEGLLTRLRGYGASGVLVEADERHLDELIGNGVREGALSF